MRNFLNVYLKLEGVIDGKDAYLTYDTTSQTGSSWRNAAFVTAEYAEVHKLPSQLRWNLLWDSDINAYRISSIANGMFLTYDHGGDKNCSVKHWMYADVMSGEYYEKMKYRSSQCEWTGPVGDGIFALEMPNNYDGRPLILALDDDISDGWAYAVVNTEAFFNDRYKPENYKMLQIDYEGPLGFRATAAQDLLSEN